MTEPQHLPESIHLADGRSLSYFEQGHPEGSPLIYLHGGPGLSRLRTHEHELATARGVRLLVPHRPGYRGSDPQPGRRMADWPDTVAEFADRLGVDRFAVVGFSNGGAHALACAWKLPDRLIGAGVASGFAPFDGPPGTEGMGREPRLLYGTGRRAPWALRPLLSAFGRVVARDPQAFYSRLNAEACDSHRAVAEEPEFFATMSGDFGADAANGCRGIHGDVVAHTSPWGFRPEDVTAPVHIWHGKLDPVVPVTHGQELARRLPRCIPTFLPDEGHEVLFTRFDEVMARLMTSDRGS